MSALDFVARAGRRPLLPAVLILSVVLGMVAVVCGTRIAAIGAQEAAHREALGAVKIHLPAMLGYDYRTLNRDFSVAERSATGRFRTEYGDLLRSVVAPNARKKKVITTAEVAAAGVVDSKGDSVFVLAFITQHTRKGTEQVATAATSRLSVRMDRTDKGWLVAAFAPI